MHRGSALAMAVRSSSPALPIVSISECETPNRLCDRLNPCKPRRSWRAKSKSKRSWPGCQAPYYARLRAFDMGAAELKLPAALPVWSSSFCDEQP